MFKGHLSGVILSSGSLSSLLLLRRRDTGWLLLKSSSGLSIVAGS